MKDYRKCSYMNKYNYKIEFKGKIPWVNGQISYVIRFSIRI